MGGGGGFNHFSQHHIWSTLDITQVIVLGYTDNQNKTDNCKTHVHILLWMASRPSRKLQKYRPLYMHFFLTYTPINLDQVHAVYHCRIETVLDRDLLKTGTLWTCKWLWSPQQADTNYMRFQTVCVCIYHTASSLRVNSSSLQCFYSVVSLYFQLRN